MPVRRAVPLIGVVAVVAGGAVLRPGAETGACAQSTTAVVPRADCAAEAAARSIAQCNAATRSLRSAAVRPRGRRGLRIAFRRYVDRPLDVDVFQVTRGRVVLGERRVARFPGRAAAVSWNGARGGDGIYVVRLRIRNAAGRRDEDRIALKRRDGRFRGLPRFYRRTSCGTLTSFRLTRPAFGGRTARALGISFRLGRRARARGDVLRGGRVVRSFRARSYPAGVFHRLRVPARGLRPGPYRVRVRIGGGPTATLAARRL